MKLKSLNFLNNLNRGNQQFAVIGLGRFGRSVCATLHELGYEVLGADIEERRVAQVLTERVAAHAIQLDSTETSALREAGILEFETVIIAIGNYLQESIITTLNVKEAGVAHVVAKASSQVHGKLLQRVGADQVVYPEYEAGRALAFRLTKPAILERFDIDSEHTIVEVLIPEQFNGKTITELELRNRYGLNIIAIGKGDHFEINPHPSQKLYKDQVMIVVGCNKDIQRLPL